MSDATAQSRQCASSQQVSWWSVHEHVTQLLDRVGDWPLIGTPEWCDLDDTDPRKVAAIFDAAQHWALRIETCQQQACEASREVSAAEDWSSFAIEALQRREVYIPREAAS